MKIIESRTIRNVHGPIYTIELRKHYETFDEYGYPYSIKITNADPHAFDLNNHTYLYDYLRTARKRLEDFCSEYEQCKPSIMEDVDAVTGRCY